MPIITMLLAFKCAKVKLPHKHESCNEGELVAVPAQQCTGQPTGCEVFPDKTRIGTLTMDDEAV